jgi:hypothetical protein
MIKNHLFGYGRLLLTLVLVSTVVLLSGCCSTFCYKDVVYQFDIPSKDKDCPRSTTYTVMDWQTNRPGCPSEDTQSASIVVRDGGAGIIDRDGGAGIIDRDECDIRRFCDASRCSNGVEPNSPVFIDWDTSASRKVLVAKRNCVDSQGSDQEQ